MRVKERIEARRLRKEEGYSLKEICTKIKVSKSSVSGWVKDIELTDEQKERLRQKYKDHYTNVNILGNNYIKNKFLEKRKKYQEEGRDLLVQLKNDTMFIAGIMIFWAEGSKDRGSVIMTNSNVNMLSFFVKFLKKYFMVGDGIIKFSFQYYSNNGIPIDDVKKYWLTGLDLPSTCFKRYTVDKRYENAPGKKIGKLLYGVGRIVVNDVRIKQMIFGAIQEFMNFKEDSWLQ